MGYTVIYDKIEQALSSGHSVVCTLDVKDLEVKERTGRRGFDVQKYLDDGVLLPINPGALENNSQGKRLVKDVLFSVLTGTQKSEKGTVAMLVPELIISQGSSMNHNPERNITAFEQAVNRKISGTNLSSLSEIICYFDSRSLSSPKLRRAIIPILNEHQYSLHEGGVYREWYRRRVIDLIKSALDEKLGQDTGAMIIKTLKLVYGYSEEEIISSPDGFEEKMQKIIGSGADRLLQAISDRIVGEMVFVNPNGCRD